MSVQVEKLEKNMAKLTIEVDTAQFEDAMKKAFNKNKNKFNIPGFHKGKASGVMTEKMYGEGIFYEDVADKAINATCIQTMNGSELEIVFRPEVSAGQIGRDKPFIYIVIVATRSEVTLGEYKSIEVEKAEAAVAAEDVDIEFKRVWEQNARQITVEDRPIADGDQTAIDFEGFVDGKSFDGDKAEDYALTIGPHSFIDTLEEQLIDKNIEGECEVNATFPEEYHTAELIDKLATFKVTVKETKVKGLSGLDDEFAGEVSESDTLDEYKKNIEAEILERKQREATIENESRMIERVVANATMEILDKMVEGQIDNMVRDIARHMQSQGLSTEMYTKYTGTTVESMREQMQPQALKRIQIRLVLEEVAKAENIQVSDERLDEEIAKMAASYQVEADKSKKYMSDHDKDQMKEDLAIQEAADFLVAEAKLV